MKNAKFVGCQTPASYTKKKYSKFQQFNLNIEKVMALQKLN